MSIQTDVAKALRAAMSTKGDTQTSLGKRLNVDQAKICRVLNGQFRRVTPAVAKLCQYADIDPVKRRDPASNATLMAALGDIWDGSERHATTIARLLRDIAAIARPGS